MKLEPGKFYRTKAGLKVGPMLYESGIWHQDGCGQIWRSDGIVEDEDGDESYDYIVAEWDDTPTLWRDMTPEEKGALLLAHHEGKVIEIWDYGEWFEAHPDWASYDAYRIRPVAQPPKRERVVLYGCSTSAFGPDYMNEDTHRITFDLIDGIPDTTSIRMETL